jgi:hypothetical protein
MLFILTLTEKKLLIPKPKMMLILLMIHCIYLLKRRMNYKTSVLNLYK